MDVKRSIPADPPPAALVTLRGVGKHYGNLCAVADATLDIHRGELFGLIGHNGAGKSTLFKMLLGLTTPSAGLIHVDGEAVNGRGFRAIRRKIGYLPENVVLYDNLTGLETLQFFARLKGVPASDCARCLEWVGLAKASTRRVREYSKGMRQRLGFAQALLGSPQLLFLDEPTVGLDPEGVRAFYGTLRELRDKGVTILLSSHILADIQERVDRLAIMASGQLRAVGSVQSLRERVDLPLYITLQINPAYRAELEQLLIHQGVQAISGGEHALSFQCRRESKMALLSTLSSLTTAVMDIHVREPSLEDVFSGISEQTTTWK